MSQRRRRLALSEPWHGAPEFYIDMVLGPPDESTGDVKARITVRAGETLLVTNDNKVKPNVVGWTSVLTQSQANALLKPLSSGAPTPLWPTPSAFESSHAAWYFAWCVAPHMLASSYCTGRRVFTAASSGQVRMIGAGLPRLQRCCACMSNAVRQERASRCLRRVATAAIPARAATEAAQIC